MPDKYSLVISIRDRYTQGSVAQQNREKAWLATLRELYTKGLLFGITSARQRALKIV